MAGAFVFLVTVDTFLTGFLLAKVRQHTVTINKALEVLASVDHAVDGLIEESERTHG